MLLTDEEMERVFAEHRPFANRHIAKAQLKNDIEKIRDGLMLQFGIWTNTHNDRTYVIDIQAWDDFWQVLQKEVE